MSLADEVLNAALAEAVVALGIFSEDGEPLDPQVRARLLRDHREEGTVRGVPLHTLDGLPDGAILLTVLAPDAIPKPEEPRIRPGLLSGRPHPDARAFLQEDSRPVNTIRPEAPAPPAFDPEEAATVLAEVRRERRLRVLRGQGGVTPETMLTLLLALRVRQLGDGEAA